MSEANLSSRGQRPVSSTQQLSWGFGLAQKEQCEKQVPRLSLAVWLAHPTSLWSQVTA